MILDDYEEVPTSYLLWSSVVLRIRYALSGTDTAHRPMPCAVLTSSMLLPGVALGRPAGTLLLCYWPTRSLGGVRY
eukprot:907834-Rhodomonas_salina.2